MFFRIFGNYLVEEEIITEVQLDALMEYKRKNHVRLGMIAMEENKMTPAQVKEVSRLQALVDKMFGEIAVEKGYLKKEELADLIIQQSAPYLLFVQGALDTKIMDKEEIAAHLQTYQDKYGWTNEQMRIIKFGSVDDVSAIIVETEDEWISDLFRLVLRNLNRFITNDLYFEAPKRMKTFSAPHFSGQEMVGDKNFMLSFAGEERSLLFIAENYAGEKKPLLNADSYDSVCEFINCINGLLARRLDEEDIDVEMLPPKYKDDFTLYASDDMYVMPVRIENMLVMVLASSGQRCVLI